MSAPFVIGSWSLNAQRNGFVHWWKTSHAARFGPDAGSSGLVGTSIGNWRAPSLYESSGNGASYAAITSGARSLRQPPFTILPTSKFGVSCENFCQARNASPGCRSPVGRNVFAATTWANRSGCSATSRSPISPPQSWPTNVASDRSTASSHAVIQSTWVWYV